MSKRSLGVLAALVLVAALLGSAPITLARFTDSDARTGSFGTATLQPPTSLAGSGGTTTATLTWTPSTSTSKTGYQVLRSATSGSGFAQVGTVTPGSATTTNDTPGTGTWYYVLRTYFASWTSANSNQAAVVIANPVSTASTPCVAGSNAAETANAGDNDGFEWLAIAACNDEGISAGDFDTGTSTTNSCTANAKDKHRWWGYAFGLPGTISSVTGITVNPILGQSNNGGTTWVCIQLSWDGGTSWTAAKSVTLTANGLTPYTLGATTDTWGRTWARAEFNTTAFRVRVIDSSSLTDKDVRLDSLDVVVTYLP